jgi:antitoxin VapB
MSLNILSEEVDRLAERLAAHTGLDKTDAIKQALENELRRLEEASPLRERIRPIQERIQQRPATGATADKAFYDDLSDEG